MEIDIRRKNGEKIKVEFSTEQIELEGEKFLINIMTDITERKRTEEIIKQNEAQYRYLFENNPLPMWAYDRETYQFLAVNDSAVQKYGYSREEFSNMTFADIRPKEDKKRLLEDLKLPRSIIQHSIDWRHQFKNGKIIDVEILSHTVELEGEKAVLVVAIDVTQKKKAEKELIESEEKFRQITETIDDVFWMADPEMSQIFYVSPAFETIWGRTRQSLLDNPNLFMESILPDDRNKFLQALILQRKGLPFAIEFKISTPNGLEKDILDRSFPIYDKNKKLTRYVGVAKDVSQRKKDRVELIKYRNHLEKLVHERTKEAEMISSKLLSLIYSMPLGYIETDLDYQITFSNQGVQNIFGFQSKEILGQNISNIFQFNQDIFNEITKINFNVKVVFQEHFFGKHNINCKWNIIKLTDKSDVLTGIAFIIEDITIMKEAEKSLNEALQKERELNELKSNFVSMTSHQFRTPLTTILSNTEMLELLIENLNNQEKEKAVKFMKRIYDNIERLDLLMSDVMLVGKNQVGKINFKPEKLKFSQIIHQLVAETNYPYQNDRKPNLIITGKEKKVFADPQLIAHVVTNLLSNAFKYSNKEVDLCIDFLENHVLIKVIDRGIGIPEKDQKKLFNIFFRGSNTENLTGTGLGLVIAREYLNMHNAKISFTSKTNEGTTFFIELPYNTLQNEKNLNN